MFFPPLVGKQAISKAVKLFNVRLEGAFPQQQEQRGSGKGLFIEIEISIYMPAAGADVLQERCSGQCPVPRCVLGGCARSVAQAFPITHNPINATQPSLSWGRASGSSPNRASGAAQTRVH